MTVSGFTYTPLGGMAYYVPSVHNGMCYHLCANSCVVVLLVPDVTTHIEVMHYVMT